MASQSNQNMYYKQRRVQEEEKVILIEAEAKIKEWTAVLDVETIKEKKEQQQPSQSEKRNQNFVRGCERGRGNYKSHFECYSCHNTGQYASKCQSNIENKEVNLVESNEDDVEQSLLLALKEDSNMKANTWCLDNGARNHMTGDRSKFVELDSSKKDFVSFGDNTTVRIEGKGTILLETKMVVIEFYVMCIMFQN